MSKNEMKHNLSKSTVGGVDIEFNKSKKTFTKPTRIACAINYNSLSKDEKASFVDELANLVKKDKTTMRTTLNRWVVTFKKEIEYIGTEIPACFVDTKDDEISKLDALLEDDIQVPSVSRVDKKVALKSDKISEPSIIAEHYGEPKTHTPKTAKKPSLVIPNAQVIKPKAKRPYTKRKMSNEKSNLGKAIRGLEAKIRDEKERIEADKMNLKTLKQTYGNMR